MDVRRFDSLVIALAAGKSRRSVLKGLLGLGGAAVIGSEVAGSDANAARRPAPSPTPIKCPGQQAPVNGQCICPAIAPNKCGPDCCTGKVTDSFPPAVNHTECCDNACCEGTCYGEELCCPTNPTGSGGKGAPLAEFCDESDSCCMAPSVCCGADGCCDTVCLSAGGGPLFCCPSEQYCPGATREGDLCCFGEEVCCNAGEEDNRCRDVSNETLCCDASDCTVPPPGTENNCPHVLECQASGTCLWTAGCSPGKTCCENVCVDGPKCCDDLGPLECCDASDCTVPPVGHENDCPRVLECQSDGQCLWTAGCPFGQTCCSNVCTVGPVCCDDLSETQCCTITDCTVPPPGTENNCPHVLECQASGTCLWTAAVRRDRRVVAMSAPTGPNAGRSRSIGMLQRSVIVSFRQSESRIAVRRCWRVKRMASVFGRLVVLPVRPVATIPA